MRNSRTLLLLAATCVAGSTAWAKSPKKAETTHILCPARYVYVATMDGDIMSPEVIPEDRDAVSRVEDQLRDWKRLIEVYKPQESDVVLIVRTGRLATAKGAVGAHVGRVPPIGGNPATRDPSDASQGPDAPASRTNAPYGPVGNGGWIGAGGDVGPPDDLLAVYQKPGDVNSQSPLWRKTEKDGLDGPAVPLFGQFRKDIDNTCQDEPDKKTKP